MKVTLAQLVNSQPALNKILEKEVEAQLAFRLGKIAKAIRSELNELDEVRSRLIKQLGAPVEGQDGKWRVTSENEPKFHEEMTKLLSEEVELDISELSLYELEGIKFTPAEMSQIDFLLIAK